MTAYFDYNVYTSLVDGEYSLEKILTGFPGINKVYYSASHVQEAYNITAPSSSQRKELIGKKLRKISEIIKDAYLYHEVASNKMHFLEEDPFVVFETISEFPFAQQAMNSFMNLVDKDQKEQFRTLMGVESRLT